MVDGVKRASLGKPDSRLPITRELLGRILPSEIVDFIAYMYTSGLAHSTVY
jgi:hypothetical protein